MLDTIVSLLKDSGVYAWEISDVKTTGWEFYFIRHALDQNRVRQVEHITVKVYQLLSDGAWLGSASGEIAPTASVEEARALIESLAYRATLVKNKPYTLHKPRPAEAAETKPIDAAAIARDFVETMRDLPETAGEDINSYEIFVAEKRRHFLNSEGIDLEESYPDSMIEVVVGICCARCSTARIASRPSRPRRWARRTCSSPGATASASMSSSPTASARRWSTGK